MLIPFGVFSAAGAGAGAAAGSYELISTAYGTGSSGTITFSSIPQTYKHLQLRVVARNTGTYFITRLQVNNDTSTNYRYHAVRGNGSAVTSTDGGGTVDGISFVGGQADSTTSGAVGVSIIDILDYSSTSKNKTIRGLSGCKDTNSWIALTSGFLPSATGAITRLDMLSVLDSFSTSSRFSLYGIKG